jgi:hypothetical protein
MHIESLPENIHELMNILGNRDWINKLYLNNKINI